MTAKPAVSGKQNVRLHDPPASSNHRLHPAVIQETKPVSAGAIRGKVLATFEGVCTLGQGSRIEIRQGYWDREVLRVAVLRNLDSQVTYKSLWQFLHADNKVKPTIGKASDVVVDNDAEETIPGDGTNTHLLVSFEFTAE
jgi:hypothetical protein